MDTIGDIPEEEIADMSQKEFRKTFPSGWMELSRYETLVLIVDVLLESNPSREFTIKELVDRSGSSRPSVVDHISSLVRLGIVNELPDRDPPRYSLNEKSPITQKLYELNLTVDKVRDGELPKTLNRKSKGGADPSINNMFNGGTSGDIRVNNPPNPVISAD